MNVKDKKIVVLDTETNTNKPLKGVAIGSIAVLAVVIGVFISVFNSTSELDKIPVAQTTTDTTVTSVTTQATRELYITPIDVPEVTTTIPKQTTTQAITQANGTTIYVQTNVPLKEGQYANKEEAQKAHQHSEEVVGVYPKAEADKIMQSLQAEVTTVATTKAPTTTAKSCVPSDDFKDKNGYSFTNPPAGYYDANGDLWEYSFVTCSWYNKSEQQRMIERNTFDDKGGNGVKVFD